MEFKIREASHRFGLKFEVEVFDLRGDLLYETGRLAAVQRAVVVRETQTHIRNETVDASAQILRPRHDRVDTQNGYLRQVDHRREDLDPVVAQIRYGERGGLRRQQVRIDRSFLAGVGHFLERP